MAPSVTEAAGEGTDSPGMHPSHGTRRLRTGQTSEVEVQRFFLAKTGSMNGVPEFSKEFRGEPEAMVESFKAGLNYFVISEWRGVADFSGKKPKLGREAVRSAPKTG